ncbi:carbamoyl-phosphate synthase small chain, partial [Striga asiatica]
PSQIRNGAKEVQATIGRLFTLLYCGLKFLKKRKETLGKRFSERIVRAPFERGKTGGQRLNHEDCKVAGLQRTAIPTFLRRMHAKNLRSDRELDIQKEGGRALELDILEAQPSEESPVFFFAKVEIFSKEKLLSPLFTRDLLF